MKYLILNILAGVLIGIACKFIGNIVEKILLDRRKLKMKRVGLKDDYIVAGMAVLGGMIMWKIPISAETIYLFLLLTICEVIAMIDCQHRMIPNELLLAILILKVGFGIPDLLGVKGFPAFDIVDSIVGLLVGFVIFIIPAFLSGQVGAGDIKLVAIAGFILGRMGCLVNIVLMGILVIIYILLQRHLPILTEIKTVIPMGPFLSASMMIVTLLPMNIDGRQMFC